MSMLTHAYVRYHDDAKCSRSGRADPSVFASVSNVSKNKLVYWAEPGEESEDYYPADVVVLGGE